MREARRWRDLDNIVTEKKRNWTLERHGGDVKNTYELDNRSIMRRKNQSICIIWESYL